jgi:hypothetical protein
MLGTPAFAHLVLRIETGTSKGIRGQTELLASLGVIGATLLTTEQGRKNAFLAIAPARLAVGEAVLKTESSA